MTPVAVEGVDVDLAGHLAVPTGRGPFPGVIVLPEVDGLGEGTLAAARRLSDAGYVALALDLYTPYGGAPVLGDRRDTLEWIHRLDDRRQVSDLASALAWLRARSAVHADRIAVVGFSIGGRYATLLATEPHDVRAVVTFYTRPWPQGAGVGSVIAPGDHLDRLLAPVCAVFGSEDDLVPPDMVERFDAGLRRRPEAGHQVCVVPGRHYFTDESRPRRFRADSAGAAWSEVLAFLDRHLSDRRLDGGVRSTV
jgi:carboxymethylenebutenolidase